MNSLPRPSRAHSLWIALPLALYACSDKPSDPAPSASPAGSVASTTTSSASARPTEPGPTVSGSAVPSSPVPSSPVPSASVPTPVASESAHPTTKPTSTPDAGTPAPTGAPSASTPPDAGTAQLPPPVPGSADEIAANLDAVYLPKKTFKARFVQKYKQKISGNEKESHGVVFVEKPNKISFRYDPPNKNRIVSDGSSVKVYIADDAQMFEQPVKGTEYPGALSFIMGEGIRSSFAFTINEKAKFDKGPVLVGKPRVESASYESALFYVDKDKLAKKDIGAMVAVLILDAQGNKNRFEFEGAETPDKIDPAEFTFTPPPGTNIQK